MTVEGSAEVSSVTITMSQSLWLAWATTAERHADSAKEARNSEGADSLYVEFCDGVVAISAVAMCCEALQRRLLAVAPIPAARPSKGHKKVRAIDRLGVVLRTALDLPSGDVERLVDAIEPYYEKRNEVAHFNESMRTPVAHPAGGNTSVETFDYRAEEADKAVAALHVVFEALLKHPAPAFRDWSKAHAHAFPGQPTRSP
jgi:hypothetical protein